MLTRDQIVSTVLGRLGRAEGNSYLVTQAGLELQLIQRDLEAGPFTPWFLHSIYSLALAANSTQASYAGLNESDIIKESDLIPLYVYPNSTDDEVILPDKKSLGFILEYNAENTTGAAPEYYARYGDVGGAYSIMVAPKADVAYSLYQGLYVRQSLLSASVTTNNWTTYASPLLVARLGMVMAGTYKGDQKRLAEFEKQAQVAYTNLFALDEARKQANREAYREDLPGRP